MAAVALELGGLSATLSVTVLPSAPTVTGLFFTGGTTLIEVGGTSAFGVTARFSDGSLREVTNDPALAFTALSPAVLAVAGPGQVRGVSPGSGRVEASFGGRPRAAPGPSSPEPRPSPSSGTRGSSASRSGEPRGAASSPSGPADLRST